MNVYINNFIFTDCVMYKNKLNLYNYKIFNKIFWIIYFMLNYITIYNCGYMKFVVHQSLIYNIFFNFI